MESLVQRALNRLLLSQNELVGEYHVKEVRYTYYFPHS